MPKRDPLQRWRDYELERLAAFERSPDMRCLRKVGLALFGRTRTFSWQEWFVLHKPVGQTERLEFVERCRPAAAVWGLELGVVVASCVVMGGYPADQLPWPVPILTGQPSARLIVPGDAISLFVDWLRYAVDSTARARSIGLGVAQTMDGRDVTLITIPRPDRPDVLLPPEARPQKERAFRLQVETPPMFPPEAASEFVRIAQRACRDVLRLLGYPVRDRLRRSNVPTELVGKLRLDTARLQPRESGDITEDIYGEGAAQDKTTRRRVTKQRHAIKRRQREQR
jgi:hypothetical protein